MPNIRIHIPHPWQQGRIAALAGGRHVLPVAPADRPALASRLGHGADGGGGVRAPAMALPQAPVATWRASMGRWLARLRERDDMARMTMREMRDAGLTPYDVERERAKPFWRA